VYAKLIPVCLLLLRKSWVPKLWWCNAGPPPGTQIGNYINLIKEVSTLLTPTILSFGFYTLVSQFDNFGTTIKYKWTKTTLVE
jgi:hypothetical protein